MSNKAKILYVDDEFINLQLFQINFQKKYDVLIAENGVLGLEKLKIDQDIQVVISDMRMPEMSGLEFIKIAQEQYPGKSFFMLSGYEETNEIQAALDSKLILKYFKKPLNVKEIDSEIAEVVNK